MQGMEVVYGRSAQGRKVVCGRSAQGRRAVYGRSAHAPAYTFTEHRGGCLISCSVTSTERQGLTDPWAGLAAIKPMSFSTVLGLQA